MLTSEEAQAAARQYVLDEYGDSVINEEHIVDAELYYLFSIVPKKFLGKRIAFGGGPGPIILDKETGQICYYGSAFGKERALEDYIATRPLLRRIHQHAPWFTRNSVCELIISKIRNKEKLTVALLEIEPTYVIPEEAYGAVWRIPQPFTKAKLLQKFESLPAIFENISGSAILHLYIAHRLDELAEIELKEKTK